MPKNQGSKGNPATHRMSNPHRKERCARAHRRTEKTKVTRKAVDEAQRKGNKILVAAGELTPWEEARRKRNIKRRPKQEAYEKSGRGAS